MMYPIEINYCFRVENATIITRGISTGDPCQQKTTNMELWQQGQIYSIYLPNFNPIFPPTDDLALHVNMASHPVQVQSPHYIPSQQIKSF